MERFESDFDAEVQGRGDQIEFRVPRKRVGEMIRMALDTGAEVRSITPHRVSLESIFLTAVEEGRRDEQGGSR